MRLARPRERRRGQRATEAVAGAEHRDPERPGGHERRRVRRATGSSETSAEPHRTCMVVIAIAVRQPPPERAAAPATAAAYAHTAARAGGRKGVGTTASATVASRAGGASWRGWIDDGASATTAAFARP